MERGSAEMASPQAMARRAGHDRAPALRAGMATTRLGERHHRILVCGKTASRRDAIGAYHMFLASLRDAVLFILGSGGIGRVATSTTGLYLASLRLALAIPLKSKEYYQLMLHGA
jgi:hypothetical protein